MKKDDSASSNNSSSDSSINNSKTEKDINKFTDYDYLIQAEYDYIFNYKGTTYQKEFTEEYKIILNSIKNDKVKKRHFLKWYLMSYSEEQIKILSNISSNKIIKSIKKYCQINLNPKFYSEISQSELGLRNYYLKKKKHFKSRVLKGPPFPFRFLSYIILSNIPDIRLSDFYDKILKNDLEENIEDQIYKDLPRTYLELVDEDNNNNNKKKNDLHNNINNIFLHMQKPLSRILKAIALIDKELSYCQGMNFIVGFLLIITNGNEIETFYLMISLLSKTYNDKYGIRGFFTPKFPLLHFYTWIFYKEFSKKFNKINQLFLSLEIPDECWISKWFQTLFIHNISNNKIIKIWDFIFSNGLKGIISISLSIIDIFEKNLEQAKDESDIIAIFKSFNDENNDLFDINKIIEFASKKYHIKKKTFSNYKKEYIIEKKIETKSSVFDDIKYDMNIISKYNIGSSLDFINNEIYDDKNIKFEVNTKDIIAKLKPCKKFPSIISVKRKYYNIEDDDDDCYFLRDSSIHHNVPSSKYTSDIIQIKNPFSQFSN